MKNEILDAYNIAIDTQDEDCIKHFQRTRDRLGPQIVMDLILENEELKEIADLAQQAMFEIMTISVDMGGKNRYHISNRAYQVIEPLRQLLNERENNKYSKA